MTTRPSTSKPRGQCCYYNQPRGCFAGNKCKFLHGESETLTMYDKSKTCRYFNNGYCRKGDKCWFVHAAPSRVEVQQGSSDDHVCCICLEKPTTYGLLSGCSHIFCIDCIRQWRDPTGKSGDVVHSGVTKRCPLCRSPSRFITPSSRFFEQGDAAKGEAIERYKKSAGKVPCMYFKGSKQTKPFCPFGADCFYQHLNDDGTPYIFKEGVDHSMKKYCRRRNGHTARSRFRSYMIHTDAAIMEGLNAAIYGLRETLRHEMEQPPEFHDGDTRGRGEEEQAMEGDGGDDEDAEEEAMGPWSLQGPWMGSLGWSANERDIDDGEVTSGSSTPTPTTTARTYTYDMIEPSVELDYLFAGPSTGESEPPFVTDGRGRVVGSSCITI